MMQGAKYLDRPKVVVLYLRLSVEDRDIDASTHKTESNSITNQRNLLWDYINSHDEFKGCKVIEKCDDGFSGTHFDDRPRFMEMIEMAKRGEADCIMVKDFSRFGRDYVELGDYLEQIFPLLGIRFLSVNDGYDSAKLGETTGGLDVAFKNMIYDFYSREFSKKQKAAWRRLAEEGKYTAHVAIYGYRKDPADCHHLLIHPENSKIVREIFEMVLAGIPATKVALSLNERKIPCPSEYHKSQGQATERWHRYGSECYWTENAVLRIIKDERYTGITILLKTGNKTVRGKRYKKPPEEWVRTENTHDAIVSQKMYHMANAMIKKVQGHPYVKWHTNIYYCGYCGRKTLQFGMGDIRICRMRKVRKDCGCCKVYFHTGKTDEIVLTALNRQIELLLKQKEMLKSVNADATPDLDMEIKAVQKALSVFKNSWMELYNRYNDGELSREEYMAKKKETDTQKAELEQKLAALKETQECNRMALKEKDNMNFDLELSYHQTELTEAIKERFIDKVLVYSDNKMEIAWKFSDERMAE